MTFPLKVYVLQFQNRSQTDPGLLRRLRHCILGISTKGVSEKNLSDETTTLAKRGINWFFIYDAFCFFSVFIPCLELRSWQLANHLIVNVCAPSRTLSCRANGESAELCSSGRKYGFVLISSHADHYHLKACISTFRYDTATL